MTRPERTVERSRDLERLITFVDAIVAVAITLLVLPLVDLASEIHSGHDSVRTLVTAHSGQFWSFGLSFLVIARLWLAQHELLRPVIASSPAVVRWLLVWALSTVFLPFPTALLPVGGSQAATKVFYIGTLALSSACLTALAVTIRRNRQIRESDDVPRAAPAARSAVLLLVALVLSLAVPHASYYPLLLLVVGDSTAALAHRLRRRPSPG